MECSVCSFREDLLRAMSRGATLLAPASYQTAYSRVLTQPRPLPPATEKPAAPFSLFMVKHGLQSGNDSYYDREGHTYKRKKVERGDHLYHTYV